MVRNDGLPHHVEGPNDHLWADQHVIRELLGFLVERRADALETSRCDQLDTRINTGSLREVRMIGVAAPGVTAFSAASG